MNTPRVGAVIAGVILILLGVALFAMQFLGNLGQSVLLIAVGTIFVVAYILTRTYGFLIPGCIVLGIGVGQLGSGVSLLAFDGFQSLALGIGFIAIFVIDFMFTGSMRWWPLIPGLILAVVALAQANDTLQVLLARGWPLILVFVGLIILAGAFGLTGRRTR